MQQRHEQKSVVIGVQARSTSKRFPGKVYATLGNGTVLSKVLSAVKGAAVYINQNESKRGVRCSYCLLVPYEDSIAQNFKVNVLEGPEDDVLTRYKMMADKFTPDYIVRITADCPMIPSPSITKIIKTGVKCGYDYLANFFELKEQNKLYRLVPDGFECEFFSRRMLDWADSEAKSQSDREHVTTIMRTYPSWGTYGVVLPYENRETKKLSVDTEEDLARVRAEVNSIDQAQMVAEQLFGRTRVHRY